MPFYAFIQFSASATRDKRTIRARGNICKNRGGGSARRGDKFTLEVVAMGKRCPRSGSEPEENSQLFRHLREKRERQWRGWARGREGERAKSRMGIGSVYINEIFIGIYRS